MFRSKRVWQQLNIHHLVLVKEGLTKPGIAALTASCHSNARLIGGNMSGGRAGKLLLPQVVEELNKFADPRLAEPWDNVGLLLEPTGPLTVHSVLLTNDLTEPVMEEALHRGVSLIVSYHPPIFAALKRITTATWKERIVAACLENKIALYSPHTSWDAVHGGVTDWLTDAFRGSFDESKREPIVPSGALLENYYNADVIGSSTEIEAAISDLSSRGVKCLPVTEIPGGKRVFKILGCTRKDIDPFLALEGTDVTMTKHEMKPNKRIGMGRIVYPQNLSVRDCIARLKTHTGLAHIRLALGIKKTEDSPVNKIAVVPGSGGSLLKGVAADLYLTGEMFHHDILEANHNGASVILLNHSDSERGFLKVMKTRLETILPEIKIFVSANDRDPIFTV